MATAHVNLKIDTTEFERGMKKMVAALKRFGASIPKVHRLDASAPIFDRLALDFAMRNKADSLEAEADNAPLVRRLYLRAVVRKIRARAVGGECA